MQVRNRVQSGAFDLIPDAVLCINLLLFQLAAHRQICVSGCVHVSDSFMSKMHLRIDKTLSKWLIKLYSRMQKGIFQVFSPICIPLWRKVHKIMRLRLMRLKFDEAMSICVHLHLPSSVLFILLLLLLSSFFFCSK